jgi:hypothetical protein
MIPIYQHGQKIFDHLCHLISLIKLLEMTRFRTRHLEATILELSTMRNYCDELPKLSRSVKNPNRLNGIHHGWQSIGDACSTLFDSSIESPAELDQHSTGYGCSRIDA